MRSNIKKLRLVRYLDAMKKLYSKANAYMQRTGSRLLPWEIVRERLDICCECDEFTGDRCNKCGCCAGAEISHFNKLAFPTEKCPADKWSEVN